MIFAPTGSGRRQNDPIHLLLQKLRLVLLCCGSHAGKAKHLFNEWDGHGWYTDVRTQKVKDCPDTPEGEYDED